MTDCREDDDDHDSNEDEDEGVLHQPLSTLLRAIEHIVEVRRGELAAPDNLGLHEISLTVTGEITVQKRLESHRNCV